jgi:hypothetical protein
VQKQDDQSLEFIDLVEAFSDHDKDGNRFVSLSEWQRPFDDTMQSIPTDQDESEEERIAHHRQEFNHYDTIPDGFLDQGELETLAKQVSAARAEAGLGNVSGAEILQALDLDADGKATFEVPRQLNPSPYAPICH